MVDMMVILQILFIQAVVVEADAAVATAVNDDEPMALMVIAGGTAAILKQYNHHT